MQALVSLLIIVFPMFAYAHVGEHKGVTPMAGVLHPFAGLDHMLAMVSVGLLSSQMGGKAIWIVPSMFVMMMGVGGVLGMENMWLPFVEYWIAGSVLGLGAAIALKQKMPLVAAMVFVGLFGLAHGHAHGTEMPQGMDGVKYAAGFMAATATLHIIGAVIGYYMVKTQRGSKLLRAVGGVIGLAGVWLLLGI